MELTNEFTVAVPVEQAWNVLTDVERIAPCLPGAQLQEVEGDEYRGIVKVKVGPITAQYKGAATFVERDDSAHRAVLRAEGRDVRGAGNASATITAQLNEAGKGTRVSVVTDLTVTGKVAQFGRGVLADVSAKLLDQFVACLEADVLTATPGGGAAESGGAAAAGAGAAPGGRAPSADGPEEPAGAASTPEAGQDPRPTPPEPIPTVPHAPTRVGVDSVLTGNGKRAGGEGNGSGPGPTEIGTARQIHAPEAEPVDLLSTAGAPMVRRFGPIVGVAVVLLWLLRRRRRRR